MPGIPKAIRKQIIEDHIPEYGGIPSEGEFLELVNTRIIQPMTIRLADDSMHQRTG